MKKTDLFKRCVGVLCALITLCSLFVSCTAKKPSQQGTSAQPTSEKDVTEEFDAMRDIPGGDYDRDYTVLSTGSLAYWLEPNGGDKVATCAYVRSMAAEQKYNISIYIANSSGDVYPPLQAAALAGDACYDLVCPHPNASMVTIMTSGYYANLTEIPTVTLNSPWYSQNQINNYLTQNNKLYFTVPDIAINSQGFFCLVYNRNVYNEFSFEEDLNEVILRGDWTAEKMNEYLKVTDFTLDGEGTGNEKYGFLCNYAPSHRWTYAFGETLLKKNSDGSFNVALTAKKMTAVAETYEKILYTHGDSVRLETYYNAGIETSENFKKFRNGNGLFINWDVGSCHSQLHDLQFSVGYAPLPKMDSKQDDYRVICASGFFAIPQNCVSLEEDGQIYEFLSAYSYQHYRPAFFEVVIGARMSEKVEDYNMLQLLHQKKFFDFGYTLDQEETFINMLSNAVIENRNPASVVVILKGNSAKLNQILDYANNLP